MHDENLFMMQLDGWQLMCCFTSHVKTLNTNIEQNWAVYTTMNPSLFYAYSIVWSENTFSFNWRLKRYILLLQTVQKIYLEVVSYYLIHLRTTENERMN